MILEAVTVHPLSHAALTVHQQAQHVTAAATMGGHAARVPLYDGTTGQGGQDDTLTGSAGALDVNEHGQVVESEVDHGSGRLVDVFSLQGQGITQASGRTLFKAAQR